MIDTVSRPHRVTIADGYTISEIIVGGWQFAAGHRSAHPDPGDVTDWIVRLADAGFTTLDCADIYTGVEELYGRVLKRYRTSSTARDAALQIHTKFVPDLDALGNMDRTYVKRVIDRSLQRLGVECLDLVQFYWWDESVPGAVDTARWLTELQDDGKIRYLGATNLDARRMKEMETAGIRFATNQVQYSLLDRRPEGDLVGYCQAKNIKLLAYGTLAGGFLSTRYLGANAPDESLNTRSLTKYHLIVGEIGGWDALQDLLASTHDVATRHRADIASVATRFVLDQPAVAACIVGMTQPSHLGDALATCRLSLSADDRDILMAVLQRLPSPPGDVYQLERDREGPHGKIMRYNLNQNGG